MWLYVYPALFGKKKEVDPNEVPVEPTSWAVYLTKLLIGAVALAVFILVMIYLR